MNKHTISISICPTRLEAGNGDVLDEDSYLDAIRQAVADNWTNARITCLQIGYDQGDDWARLNGRESRELYEMIDSIDTTDPALYREHGDE
jgi:hypothetical protein